MRLQSVSNGRARTPLLRRNLSPPMPSTGAAGAVGFSRSGGTRVRDQSRVECSRAPRRFLRPARTLRQGRARPVGSVAISSANTATGITHGRCSSSSTLLGCQASDAGRLASHEEHPQHPQRSAPAGRPLKPLPTDSLASTSARVLPCPRPQPALSNPHAALGSPCRRLGTVARNATRQRGVMVSGQGSSPGDSQQVQ